MSILARSIRVRIYFGKYFFILEIIYIYIKSMVSIGGGDVSGGGGLSLQRSRP